MRAELTEEITAPTRNCVGHTTRVAYPGVDTQKGVTASGRAGAPLRPPGPTWPDLARPGPTWLDLARPGSTWHDLARARATTVPALKRRWQGVMKGPAGRRRPAPVVEVFVVSRAQISPKVIIA